MSDPAPVPCPLRLVEVRPDPGLTARFCRSQGWNGADGAHSVRLQDGRVLWWFGDTFVGKVQGNRRLPDTAMLNNTGALQPPRGAWSFFYPARQGRPAAWLVPNAVRQGGEASSQPQHAGTALPRPGPSPSPAALAAQWYWPGDLAADGRRLAMFAMRIAPRPRAAKEAEGFDFEEVANDLLVVSDTSGPPLAWEATRWTLPDGLRLGAACLLDGGYLYAYGIVAGAPALERPLGLARLPRTRLDQPTQRSWELWCGTQGWQAAASPQPRPATLFADAAPEMSISQVRGIPGYVAVYTPSGLGYEICARHARRPEGPWSAPLVLYRCPEQQRGLLVYGARNHPEQASRDAELVVTYNRNTPRAAEHFSDASIYRPQALRVRLRWKGGEP